MYHFKDINDRPSFFFYICKKMLTQKYFVSELNMSKIKPANTS